MDFPTSRDARCRHRTATLGSARTCSCFLLRRLAARHPCASKPLQVVSRNADTLGLCQRQASGTRHLTDPSRITTARQQSIHFCESYSEPGEFSIPSDVVKRVEPRILFRICQNLGFAQYAPSRSVKLLLHADTALNWRTARSQSESLSPRFRFSRSAA